MSSNDSIVGPVPNGWRIANIGELCNRAGGSVQTGPFGSQLHASDYKPLGTPVVMPKNLGRNKIIEADIARIGHEDASRLSKHQLKAGDIVFPRRGDISRYAHITEMYVGWLCGTGCLRIRLGEGEIDSLFLTYYLGHPAAQEWIANNAVGTTMPNLNTSIIRALPVSLPPLLEQRRIAGILHTLDDKIELNRRMNHTLEAIARAIFKSWFVDFDPVWAKIEGEQPHGMDTATATLFPDTFADSPLGPIPEGWRVKPLDQIAHYQNGLALQKYPPESDEFLPVIKIRELRQGASDESSGQASPNITEACIIDDGDVIFSWSGSLLVEIWCGGRGALNQHLFKVTSADHPRWFYYHWTKHHLSEFQRIAAGKATTMGHIKRHHLSEALVVVPSDGILKAADEVIKPIIEAIVNNNVQSRTLVELRDTLLPQLISGQLRVPDPKGLKDL